MTQKKYQWAKWGDVNAFFGLMLDNIVGLVLLVMMLAQVFNFPVDFALAYMVPGTAIGVLVGDLLFFWLAHVHARKTGNDKVTAMPLGLDTPSTIGMILFVLGPSYVAGLESGLSEHEAATRTWHIGMCAILISGIVKGLLSFCSDWIRRVIPRAALLGSLAGIALALIAFLPTEKLIANPLVGFTSLIIVLIALIGRRSLPYKIPGALAAVVVGTMIWYVLYWIQEGTGSHFFEVETGIKSHFFPTGWLSALTFQWLGAMPDTFQYLGYILPFAICTVIGGIDCTESAASVGDDFKTNQVIGIEAIATFAASIFGGVIQTTPYIGHPAYKAMGGRAAYTLATALFVGGAGVIGYFSLVLAWIPEAALLPILVFIGLEITAQSFHATPHKHFPAVAIALIPACAKLVMIHLDQFGIAGQALSSQQETLKLSLTLLSGGFIVTSVIWAAMTAKIIDRQYVSASIYLVVAGALTSFGLMHSPFAGEQMFFPWDLFDASVAAEQRSVVIQLAAAYFVMAGIVVAMAVMPKEKNVKTNS